jgi:hypothetical protein
MTGFFFGAILLLTVGVWIALVVMDGGDDSRPWRLLSLLFLAAAPTLLFSSIVLYAFRAAPAGEYRVALEGVELRLGAGEAVTIGGGTHGDEADDVIVNDLPPRFLTFRVEGDAVVVELPAELDHEIENPQYAAVRVDGNKPFANSISLAAHPRVIVNLREQERVTLDVGKQAFGSGGAIWSIVPKRTQPFGSVSVPIGRNLAADTAMYPLRYWARPRGSHDSSTGSDGAPLGSFLSWENGFFRQDLYLTLVGDGASVTLPDGTVKRYERRVAEIRAGKGHDFAVYRLDYSDPAADKDNRSRAQERRSFRASYDDGRLSIVFDTPDMVRLSSASVAKLVAREKVKTSFLLATRDPTRNAPIASNQMILSFPQLGRRVQNEFYSAIRVSEDGDCAVRVTSHTGTKCHDSGDAFRIGQDAAAILRLTRMQVPWGIILTVLTLSLCSAAWAWQHSDSTMPQILISAAEVLLAVRLLIAYEGALLDPASASALWESLVIFAILPFTLRVASALSALRTEKSPNLTRTRAALLAQALVVITLVAMTLSQVPARPWTIRLICAVIAIMPFAISWAAPRMLDALTTSTKRTGTIFVFAALIIAARVAMLVVLGWKERISFGAGAELAVTAIYLPVVFLFFMFLWDRYRRSVNEPASWRQIGIAALFVFFGAVLMMAIPVAVKDSGSALVHVPAIALLFALPALVRPNWKKIVLALPFVLIVFLHVGVLVTPHLRGKEEGNPARNNEYQRALTTEADANQYIEQRLKQSANELRVMASIAPHQLADAGTSKAEGLVMQRRMLDRYGGRGLFGAGYLQVPLTFFRDTHLNDNLSAIHILAPFGAAGALGIVALLFALALLPLIAHVSALPESSRETPESALDQRSALAIMALWTFSICGIYMFAANLGLVLFTGKNVYLLAAASKSDAIEGGTLLLIALLALSPAKAPTKPVAETAPTPGDMPHIEEPAS